MGRFTTSFLLFWFFILPARAAFTSFYIFGDSITTTTNNTSGGSNYYGQRYSNGRVWVEVLAQRQGVVYDPSENVSYFGHDSAHLIASVNNSPSQPDAGTALFVIWVNSADLFDFWAAYSTSSSQWATAINQAQTNQLNAIQTLWNKGARTFLMPGAVDITQTPNFNSLTASQQTFLRQRAIDYNTAFAVTLDLARSSHPGIVIYEPNLFALVDDFMAHPANYGLTKTNIGVLQDSISHALNGPGTNYVYWDQLDPTAKVHAIIADTIQQTFWPPQFSKITALNGSNQLDVVNVPIGRDGFVDGSADLVTWDSDSAFDSTNITQSVFLPVSDPSRFYRLRFPFVWTWP
jgi:phospholipase/lecithinase/hemolysin